MTDAINYLRRCADNRVLEASLTPAQCREIVQMHDDLQAEVDRITEAGRAHIRRAAAFEAQRDELKAELAARLAEIERAEPVAWVPVHPREGALWSMTTATPSEERLPSNYPLSPLYDRPAPAAAPERSEPADGCGACGDACAERGSCRLADESPKPAARPCRCGPDGCPDRVRAARRSAPPR